MDKKEITTIRLSKKTKKKLEKFRIHDDETFENIIKRAIIEYDNKS